MGFRDATREDFSALADWLLTRALEHDKPSLLFQLACEHLHAEKIIRPGVTRIERLVMETRERGHRETFRRLVSFFTEERLVQLDLLLVREERLAVRRLYGLANGRPQTLPRRSWRSSRSSTFCVSWA
jgi:hypothetical protein